MKIEIWSDLVCPFCYIGKRKLENALEVFSAREHVEIVWRSFQLDPGMEYISGQSVHEYLGKRKGGTTADGKRMNNQMAAMAKEVGLEFDFDNAIITNTFHAHRLLHLAKEKGLQTSMKERLFKAYYTEGKNIGDFGTLTQLAAEIGLNPTEVAQVLQTASFAAEVRADQYDAQQLGANGVPFLVFNNKYAVSGAQPTEVFARLLQEVWNDENQAVLAPEGEGSCTVDGVCN